MRRLIVICDDDPGIAEGLASMFRRYDEFEVETCQYAGEVLDFISTGRIPNALIVARTISYGTAGIALDEATDSRQLDGGIRLIECLLRMAEPTSVRGNFQFIAFLDSFGFEDLPVSRAMRAVLDRRPDLNLFVKPFDTFHLDVLLCESLGVPCDLHPDLIRDVKTEIAEAERRAEE
jgi:hypothetical protein